MPEDSLTFTEGNKVPDKEDAVDNGEFWSPSEEETKIVQRVLSRVEEDMYSTQSSHHTEWDDATQIYEAFTEPRKNRPNFQLPISHMLIETALAEEVDAFPDVELEAQDDDDVSKLPIMNSAKKYALARTNWEAIKIDARRICRIYGIAPVRISYIRETRKIKERVGIKYGADDGAMIAYRDTWDYPVDDIMMEVIDNPRRFLIDPNVRDISDHRTVDCALFTEVSWEAYKQSVQHNRFYQNVDKVKPGANYHLDMNGLLVPPDVTATDSRQHNVTILEYWNQKTDEYIVIANGVLIRSGPLPDDHKTLPFAVMHMYRRPHTFYSKGVPKLVESIEAAYNKMMNATTQATGLSFPIIVTSEDAGIDPRAIAAYPGIVMDGALDKLKLEQLGSVPSEVYSYAEKLESWLIWVSGINFQNIFGQQSDRVGIEALKKEGMLTRVNFNLRDNEANFVVRLADLLIQDIQQYYPAMRIRAITAKDDLGNVAEDKKVVDKETGMVRGILEDRRIPIDAGIQFTEHENKEKGVFELKAELSDKKSYILARPEYIRTKTRFAIRSVRPSAMGSSKEAKKLMLQELLSTALDVNGAQAQMGTTTDPKTGQTTPGKPVFNIPYLAQRLVEAFELPINKALKDENQDSGKQAQNAMQDLGQGFMDSFNHNPIEFNPEGTNPLSQMMPNMAATPQGQQQIGSMPPQDKAQIAASIG